MEKFNVRSFDKYLVRTPDSDFEDDGTKFKRYAYKDLLSITYATSKGEVYISLDSLKEVPWEFLLNFQEYQKLASQFNGISRESLELTNDNVQKAIETAANIIQSEILPAWENEKRSVMTSTNIEKTQKMYQDSENKKVATVKELVNKINFDILLKINKYALETLKSYYKSLLNEANRICTNWKPGYGTVKKAIASNFVLQNEETFYVDAIKKILKDVGIE